MFSHTESNWSNTSPNICFTHITCCILSHIRPGMVKEFCITKIIITLLQYSQRTVIDSPRYTDNKSIVDTPICMECFICNTHYIEIPNQRRLFYILWQQFPWILFTTQYDILIPHPPQTFVKCTPINSYIWTLHITLLIQSNFKPYLDDAKPSNDSLPNSMIHNVILPPTYVLKQDLCILTNT